MNKLVILLLLWMTMPLLTNAQEDARSVFVKNKTWDQVLSLAKLEGKTIMAYIFTSNYDPCIKMDQEVFSDPRIIKLLTTDVLVVRIQYDSLTTDPANTVYWRRWYKDQQALFEHAKFFDIPTFLFYSTEGNIVYKSSGFKKVTSLQNIVKFASDPLRKHYEADLAQYKSGEKEYSKLMDLARVTRNLYGDEKLTMAIAKDYKEGYLDQLPHKDKLEIEEIYFLNDYGEGIINPNDKFFNTAYHTPLQIDSVLGSGIANEYVSGVILKFMIHPALFVDKKRINGKPDWEGLIRSIREKYPKFDSEKLILIEKAKYFKEIGDWVMYTNFQTELITEYPPNSAFFGLNAPAWEVFLNSKEPIALNRALIWVEKAINMEPNNVQFVDTKANLLYKLGHNDSAIACEKKAIQLAKMLPIRGSDGKPPFMEEYILILNKMEKGLPTWE
ncbi:MAG: hypothetical protein V4594_10850 [Bacteroidota bacterium]